MTRAASALQGCSQCYRYLGIRCKIAMSLAIAAAAAPKIRAAASLSAVEPFSVAVAGSIVASADSSTVMTAAMRFVLSAKIVAFPR